MNVTEHLQVIVMEECAEVAQRFSKALRFGMAEVQPGQPLTNRERVVQELTDLMAVLEMLGIHQSELSDMAAMQAKQTKVRQFLELSKTQGTLSGDITYPCGVCAAVFTNVVEVKHHRSNVHSLLPTLDRSGLYRCVTCGEGFDHPAKVDSHAQTVHGRVRCDTLQK